MDLKLPPVDDAATAFLQQQQQQQQQCVFMRPEVLDMRCKVRGWVARPRGRAVLCVVPLIHLEWLEWKQASHRPVRCLPSTGDQRRSQCSMSGTRRMRGRCRKGEHGAFPGPSAGPNCAQLPSIALR